jgi:fructoselysine-6-P-deglycase FrlB-like protein
VNVDGFLKDIFREPASLDGLALSAPLRPLKLSEPPERVLFLGMGSSRYAAMAAAALLRSVGVDAYAEMASTTTPQPPKPGTLVVGISASGGSVETVEALERHRVEGRLPLVALTNAPESSLADAADVVLDLACGVEEGGIACRSYQATLAMLFMLCDRYWNVGATPDLLQRAAQAQDTLFESRSHWLKPLVNRVDGGAGVWVTAPDARFGSACQSALMLREAPRIVADACETGDWLHVDVYLTKRPGYHLLLLTGSPYDLEVYGWLKERDFTITAVGIDVVGSQPFIRLSGDDNPVIRALVETSVSELLAAELWRRHPI